MWPWLNLVKGSYGIRHFYFPTSKFWNKDLWKFLWKKVKDKSFLKFELNVEWTACGVGPVCLGLEECMIWCIGCLTLKQGSLPWAPQMQISFLLDHIFLTWDNCTWMWSTLVVLRQAKSSVDAKSSQETAVERVTGREWALSFTFIEIFEYI